MAVIFQDFLRYELSAAANIGVGHDDFADRDRVRSAAQQAGADPFLAALPHGYDTLLSQAFLGGSELSAGQWQRVALARAFFRDAPFVILDEPTASLDARAEHELIERTRPLLADRAVLISIRFSDELYHRLRRRADQEGEPLSTLAQQGIDEWLRSAEHPGVVFRDGPTGRRAALAAGPDVWEVAAVLAQQKGSPEKRVATTAAHLGLPIRHVEIAADYWAAHRAEIDGRVNANIEAAERELAAWEKRRANLGA